MNIELQWEIPTTSGLLLDQQIPTFCGTLSRLPAVSLTSVISSSS